MACELLRGILYGVFHSLVGEEGVFGGTILGKPSLFFWEIFLLACGCRISGLSALISSYFVIAMADVVVES